jgi:hypothetical protein
MKREGELGRASVALLSRLNSDVFAAYRLDSHYSTEMATKDTNKRSASDMEAPAPEQTTTDPDTGDDAVLFTMADLWRQQREVVELTERLKPNPDKLQLLANFCQHLLDDVDYFPYGLAQHNAASPFGDLFTKDGGYFELRELSPELEARVIKAGIKDRGTGAMELFWLKSFALGRLVFLPPALYDDDELDSKKIKLDPAEPAVPTTPSASSAASYLDRALASLEACLPHINDGTGFGSPDQIDLLVMASFVDLNKRRGLVVAEEQDAKIVFHQFYHEGADPFTHLILYGDLMVEKPSFIFTHTDPVAVYIGRG